MSSPTDQVGAEPSSDRVIWILRTAAEVFAEGALKFAAVLEEGEFEPISGSEAVRLFGLKLHQIAEGLADLNGRW